jgi:hypothetical protein
MPDFRHFAGQNLLGALEMCLKPLHFWLKLLSTVQETGIPGFRE